MFAVNIKKGIPCTKKRFLVTRDIICHKSSFHRSKSNTGIKTIIFTRSNFLSDIFLKLIQSTKHQILYVM